MIVKLLTEHHLAFLSLTGGWSESTLVKMPHCWKSHATAHITFTADPCSSNSCNVSQTCSPGPGSDRGYICKCPPGYAGDCDECEGMVNSK